MKAEEIRQKRQEAIRKIGPWVAHNIHLGEGVYTLNDKEVTHGELSLRRIVQVASDISGGNLNGLLVLDLGCLEGMYAVEFALHGAKTTAVEGREAHIKRIKFVKELLSLENLEIFHDDVRNLNKDKYGQFDIVLCLGLLYHLDIPDVFCFIGKLAEVCKRALIISTHISLAPEESYIYKEKQYWGKRWTEHPTFSTQERRTLNMFVSLDNPKSFMFTKFSLYNILSHEGFNSIYQCYNPSVLKEPRNLTVILALKGKSEPIISSPNLNLLSQQDWPEQAYHPLVTKIMKFLLIKRLFHLLELARMSKKRGA